MQESEDEQLTSDRDNLYFFKIQISEKGFKIRYEL